MEGRPGAAGALGLGVDFLAAQVVGKVDAVEADPVKGAGVELHWLTLPITRRQNLSDSTSNLSTVGFMGVVRPFHHGRY